MAYGSIGRDPVTPTATDAAAAVPLDDSSGGEVQVAVSPWRRAVGVFIQNKLAVIGLAVIIALVLFCFVGPLFYHTDQVHTNLMNANLPPGNGHPLGTDPTGYDELGRLMYGGQASLEVGIAAAVLATIVGTLYGAISGYIGGAVDAVMMRMVDGLLAIPSLFILLVLSVIFHPSTGIMILIIAFFSWLGASRLVRGEALSLRVREYVQAVKVMGGGGGRAVVRHVAPNAIGTVVVFATFTVADSIITLSVLGYLGLGIQPPQTDWGAMLSTATTYMNSGYWWLIYPPGLAIVLVAIAFNFLGDALRDAFDSRLRAR
ncbi:ABC transporter permease [Microlunatus elymi]|uniref:ABC transporter permease n=1 Tax=Microlunatus elymi TaxID=2596828 RepID=A0A516Q3E7_9ACTN|nr:ABC transporter permease [Microlunatus elymi]QDP97938.1 ABC transporter permease [Microlunatus elymi]